LNNLIRHGSHNAMNVDLEQLQALTDLFADAEAIVELYWDTDNGQRLSTSLERARIAFPRVSEQLLRPAHGTQVQSTLKPSTN
jgi:hypothetical protein